MKPFIARISILALLSITLSMLSNTAEAQKSESVETPEYSLKRQRRQSVQMPRYSIRFDPLAIAFREIGLSAAYRIHHNNYLEAEAGYVYPHAYNSTNIYWSGRNHSVFLNSRGWYAGLIYQAMTDLNPADDYGKLFKNASYVDFGLNVKRTFRESNRFETFAALEEDVGIAGENRTIYGADFRLREVFYLSSKFHLDFFIAMGLRYHIVRQDRFYYPYTAQNWEDALGVHNENYLDGALSAGLRLYWNP